MTGPFPAAHILLFAAGTALWFWPEVLSNRLADVEAGMNRFGHLLRHRHPSLLPRNPEAWRSAGAVRFVQGFGLVLAASSLLQLLLLGDRW
jgi:hypothetical protein